MVKEFEKVGRMDIREVVSDKDWQRLRSSFIGTWKKIPRDNVRRLRVYLGNMTCPYRLRRVHNYLTGSAFRIGIISHPEIDRLLTIVRNVRRDGLKNYSLIKK